MDSLQENSQSQNPSCDDMAIGKKRKRSFSPNEEDGQPAVKYLELAQVFTLDRFSDEVLFEIFKHLDTRTILALEKTCLRFCGIVQDRRLWKDIDLIDEEKNVEELTSILKHGHNKTNSIKVRGALREEIVPEEWKKQKQCILKHVLPNCVNLTDMELQSVFVDFSTIKVAHFPVNLKRLVFRDVYVRWPDSEPTVFQKMDKTLLWLEELRVESCTWFHPYDIMLFSKCPSLKSLSMRGCQNLSDFVPYGSMASRFGFKTLEHLDVRDTPITDSDLQCFNAIVTLKELLLECPFHLRKKSSSEKESSPLQYHTSDFICSDSSDSSSSSSAKSLFVDRLGTPEPSADDSTDEAKPGPSRPSRVRPEPRNVLMTIDLQNQTRTVFVHAPTLGTPSPEVRIQNPDARQSGGYRSFWDMIYRQTGPMNRTGPPQKSQISPISNRGISCFGRPLNPVDNNIIWIRIGHRPSDNSFQRLSVRHYERITDDSLRHLGQCSPDLVYLDVSGCGVTQNGIDEFKTLMPDCEVVFDDID